MNLRHSFAYTAFLSCFGIFFFAITTQTWIQLAKKKCSCVNIDIKSSTEIFKDALARTKSSKWIDDFQPVSGEDIQVYSAFIEGKFKVRVIGITNDTNADLHCILWYSSSSITTKLVKAYTANINENHGKRVTAAYFLCYLCGLDRPDAVSIVNASTLHTPSNILPVHVIEKGKKTDYFTMCLSPIHGSFNDSLNVLEWIEFNKMLGVNKLMIYVNNVTSEVRKVLNFYHEHDVRVTVLPWSLSSFLCDGNQIHYCGQLAALNDCLYRSKGLSHYIATTDLDEFIIPQQTDDFSWFDMFKKLSDKNVYLFGNSFLTTNETDKNNGGEGVTLMTDNLLRDDFIFGPRDRSKMIAWADSVVTFGIHNVWALQKGEEYYVDSSIGLLHHYRKSRVKYPEGVTVTRHISNVTLKYSKDLKDNIALASQNIKQNTFSNKVS